MPPATHILPKHMENDGEKGPQKPEKSRRTGKLTKIACYECRKRKCKCDGKQPVCGPCQGRNAVCDFDAISGSASTEELKRRVRSLEANNQTLTHDNSRMWGENQDLQIQVRRLTNELGYSQQPSNWDDYGPDSSFSGGQPMMVDDSGDQKQTQPQDADRSNLNQAFESFLNGRRQAVSEGRSMNRSAEDVLPTLDVTSLFQPSHIPEELSHWALQLSLTEMRDSMLGKLADAYVTYLQLCWLILPIEETADLLPEFIKLSSLNQLCIPHAVDVNVFQDDRLEAPMVSVADAVPGSAGGLPTLLASSLAPWPRIEQEATYMEEPGHKMRLTRMFEAFVRNTENWATRVDAHRSRHQSVASGSSHASAVMSE